MRDELPNRSRWLLRSGVLLGLAVAGLLLLDNCTRQPQSAAADAAESLLLNGQALAALNAVETCLAQYPDDARLHELRLHALLKLERLTVALPVLQRAADPAAVLRGALAHDDPGIRAAALRLVADHGLPVTCRDLAPLFNDPGAAVRLQAARVAAGRRDCELNQPLYRLLYDDEVAVRRAAINAFADRQDPRATGWLIAVLDLANTNLTGEAQAALTRLACAANHDLLRRVLHEGGEPRRLGAAIALAQLHDETALPALRAAARRGEVAQRCRVVRALAEYPGAAGRQALTELAGDGEPAVREEAQRALQRNPVPE